MERKNNIKRMLLQFGVPANLSGFKILVEAIDIWIEKAPDKPKMVADIYEPLGKKFECGKGPAERRMRHAVQSAGIDPTDEFTYIFRREGIPTVSQFIGTIAELIIMDLEETEERS